MSAAGKLIAETMDEKEKTRADAIMHGWLAFSGLIFSVEAQAPGATQSSSELPGLGRDPRTMTYIKASNAGAYERFGQSIALSADGTTLVVGAVFEDSGDMGIDADQSDFSAPNAGAVYVFTHTGIGWSQQAFIKASNTDDFLPN